MHFLAVHTRAKGIRHPGQGTWHLGHLFVCPGRIESEALLYSNNDEVDSRLGSRKPRQLAVSFHRRCTSANHLCLPRISRTWNRYLAFPFDNASLLDRESFGRLPRRLRGNPSTILHQFPQTFASVLPSFRVTSPAFICFQPAESKI